jgi:hypothetical protein
MYESREGPAKMAAATEAESELTQSDCSIKPLADEPLSMDLERLVRFVEDDIRVLRPPGYVIAYSLDL